MMSEIVECNGMSVCAACDQTNRYSRVRSEFVDGKRSSRFRGNSIRWTEGYPGKQQPF